MTGTDIAVRRLVSQGLARPAFADPAEVVRWMGAVQAQEYPWSAWALGCRMGRATEWGIEEAIAARTILRTWPMRGTVHFVPSEDARWMVNLMATRVISRAGSVYRQAGLENETFARARPIVARALEGGKQLTRPALYARLEAEGIATANSRGLHLTGRMALEGLICFASREGKHPTFALLDEWAPSHRTPTREEALAEMVLRYFRSHGPATLRDFQWWTGLTVTETQEGLDAVRSRLIEETIGGKTYWLAEAPPGAPAHSPVFHLLPPFDEILVSYKDRNASLNPQYAGLWVDRDHLASSTIVSDGRVIGTWKRAFTKGAVEIAATFARPLTGAEQAAFEAATRRYGDFVGLPAISTIAEAITAPA